MLNYVDVYVIELERAFDLGTNVFIQTSMFECSIEGVSRAFLTQCVLS